MGGLRLLRGLRDIFGALGEGVTGEWRKLRNEELIDLYGLPNIAGDKSGKNEMDGHLARMEKERCN
jgi:hypothetical protein